MQASQLMHRYMARMLLYLSVPVVRGCHENTDDDNDDATGLVYLSVVPSASELAYVLPTTVHIIYTSR